MPHLWRKPDLKWEGFEPHSYSLDTKKVWDLPVKSVSTGEAITIGSVISSFQGQEVKVDNQTTRVSIKSASREMVVSGLHVHLVLLQLMYWFADQKVSPFDVRWYYYDSDTSRTDPHSSYSFFLVAGDKIIDPHFTLSDWIDSGFDPSLLDSYTDLEPSWRSEPHWSEAYDKFWYRKFYTETRQGQLMVLRPDEPQLYHYPEGRYKSLGGPEAWLGQIHGLVIGIRFAIWLLVVVAVLELYLHWK